MTRDSERLDLESASSAYRRRRCVGSANLVRALRAAGKLTRTPTQDALTGSRVHRAWCGEQIADLSPRELDTLISLQRMEGMLVTDWAAGGEFVCLGREQRLWLHDRLEPIHSGAFDVAYGALGDRRMLIIDGKTLFGEISPAEENDQLRELVALARANFGRCTEFTVAILQPWVSARPSVALYDETEAELALRELRRTISDNADPDAPRTAGAWCEHCPAFDSCDESRKLCARTVDVARGIEDGTFALPTGPSGARLLDAVKIGSKYLEAILKRYKAILSETPDAVPGWYLKDGRKVREIKDVLAAEQISVEFMSQEQFFGAANISVGALLELVSRSSGLRGKALEDLFNARFASVITLKAEEPFLARRAKTKPKELN